VSLHSASTFSPLAFKTESRHALRARLRPCRSRCRPPAPVRAAAASPGSHRPHSPTKSPSTLSSTCCCSPSRSRAPPSSHLAGAPAPAATAAGHRRAPLAGTFHPNQAYEPVAGESLVVSPTFLGPPRRRSRRISADIAAPWPRDPIAFLSFCLRCFVRSKGISLKFWKVPGTSVKVGFLNSV
jgi:hypothetical protein